MPTYEYRVIEKGCEYCRSKFEVRQGINEEPLKSCPKCEAAVKRLFSIPSIRREPTLTEEERFYTTAADNARERVAGNISPEENE